MLKHIEGVVMNVIVYIIQHNVSGNMTFPYLVVITKALSVNCNARDIICSMQFCLSTSATAIVLTVLITYFLSNKCMHVFSKRFYDVFWGPSV